MDDQTIIDLYWKRSESAISETDKKYGGYCYSIAYNILENREDSEESVSDAVLVDYLRCDAGKSPSNPWFRSSDASGQDISLQAISREEAERIISSYVPVELEMKPITEYPLE